MRASRSNSITAAGRSSVSSGPAEASATEVARMISSTDFTIVTGVMPFSRL